MAMKGKPMPAKKDMPHKPKDMPMKKGKKY